jgi:hypothetical protein
MNVNREEIYAALFAHLNAQKTNNILTTASRRLRHIEECQPAEFPCAFQVQDTETANGRPKLPTIWTLNAEWWVYSYEPDTNAAPSTKLNPILDALTEALDPEVPVTLETLSGRVYHAMISGSVEIIEGVLGDRALAIIPIKIIKAD